MAAKVMRLVEYSSCGGAGDISVLKHVEEGSFPVPKADEVVVKVEATSLNPLDTAIQFGKFRPFVPRRFPYIPGTDIAGEIVEVGARVSKFKIGDKVVAWLHLVGGGLAEYAAAKERMTVIRPKEVSAVEAAGLPIAGITALEALTVHCGLKLDGTGAKKNILITSASGGVGHYAVQLAKLANTHVTATCGARNIELVKSLGADEVIDYRTPEGAALTSPSGKKYDYVVHGARGIPWSTLEPNLAAKARVIDLNVGPSSLWTYVVNKFTFPNKQLVPLIALQVKAENLEFLVNLLKEKKLKTIVGSRFPLSKAEDAWEKMAGGHATGKIIVEP